MTRQKQDTSRESDGTPLPKHIYDEGNGLDYTLSEDGYYLPDLLAPEASGEGENRPPAHFGRLRQRFLKEHHRIDYLTMKTDGTLFAHLHEIDTAADERFEHIVDQMVRAESITEAMKTADQMAWTGAMNNIGHRAHEIVCSELIYF